MPIAAFMLGDRVAFERAAWLADFDQLKRETERNYGNLKWATSSKAVDLPALNRTALDALARVKTDSEARAAIAIFIAGFNDGHFHIESGPPRPIAALIDLLPRSHDEPRIDFAMNAAEACKALGYKRKRPSSDIEHAGLTEDPSTEFAGGVLTLENGRRYGIIRVPLFRQYAYGASCDRAWLAFHSARDGVCDADCQDDFSHGGGTEWADYAAAALTPIALASPRVACDLSPIWSGNRVACWNVVEKPRYRTDAYLSELRQPQPYDGKLYIMVDENTASASELFAAVLQDNRAATIIGTKTVGVGCGYTNGG
ncbi:MAG: S41 family peptidase, partial [Gemmatimonadota bacterium]